MDIAFNISVANFLFYHKAIIAQHEKDIFNETN